MAYISNKGFVLPMSILDDKMVNKIKTELEVSPDINFGNFIPESFKVYSSNTANFYVPIYYGITLGFEYTTKFEKYDSVSFEDCIILRDEQTPCFDKCIEEKGKDFGGGIINVTTAFGKTVLGIKLASEFKCKTLIIVNKLELVEQWKKEIKKFAPEATIGIIQGKHFDIENKDIVIGMLQSITIKNSLKSKDFVSFGMCIIDEVQNIPTKIFSKITKKIRPRYMFGLTATLERKDKLENVIKWYTGDVVYTNISNSLKQTTEIHVYKYKGSSSISQELRDGSIAYSSMLSNISLDTDRNKLIINIINELLQEKDRNILVLSDRTSQLKYLNKHLGDEVSGLFIGSVKHDKLEETKTKRVLLGTYSMCSVGFSLAKLNCLVFATPRSSITQAIGRIFRKEHTTITPVIVDVVDQFSVYSGQYYRRKKIYNTSVKSPSFNVFNFTDTEDTESAEINSFLFEDSD